MVTRGHSGDKVAMRGQDSPLSPPGDPDLTSSMGLWCADGQGAQVRSWHLCSHCQGVSHSRWLAHLHLGAGGRKLGSWFVWLWQASECWCVAVILSASLLSIFLTY